MIKQASKVLLAPFMKTLIGALRPSARLYTSGGQVLRIALSAFMVLPALVQSTVGQGLEEVHFRQDVMTPSGTALGGAVDLTLRSDGSYTAHFHMHDSGAVDYDFVVRAVFGASNGTTFALQYSGHVEGTESTTLTRSPRRNSDKDIAGFHQFIKNNWPAVKAGKMSVSKDYSKAGVIGFIEDLSKIVVELTSGAARGAVSSVIALGDEMVQAFGNLEQSGTISVIAGVVVFASGGGAVMAVTTGVQAGLMTKALIKNRPLTGPEYDFANLVFNGTLPAAQNIILTNLEGLGGRAFTMPGLGNKFYINIGAYAYDHPLTHLRSENDNPGRLFIHELTHVWQIHHKKFVPGWVCSGLISQAGNTFVDAYEYRSKGFLPWTQFNIEQQAALVDEWFGRRQARAAVKQNPEDSTDSYFRYIRDDVREGRTPTPPMAPIQAFEGGWHTVTNQNGHYTVILTITNLGQDPMLNETFVTGQFINTDGATQYNGILRGIIPRATRTLFYDYSQPGIKAGGKGQFTLSHDGNAITGNGTADGATFTWNGTRAKPPAIIASQPILQPAFVSVYLSWDGTPDHPNAEVWVSVNGQAEIPAATLYGDVFKQAKIASFELRLQRGSGVYKYVLKDRGNNLASVVVPVP